MKVAICEIDDICTKKIKKVLSTINEKSDIPLSILSFKNPFNLLAYYSNFRDLDILILNIEMQNVYDVSKELRKLDKKIRIIFVADKSQMAIKGYNVNASHYFLKPINLLAFQKLLKELMQEIESENFNFILNRNGNRLDKIYYNEIKFIETYERKTMIHSVQESYVSNSTMKEHLARLNAYGFVQVHSGYIVNINFIKSILSNMIILRDGEHIALSKKRRKIFIEIVQNYRKRKIASTFSKLSYVR